LKLLGERSTSRSNARPVMTSSELNDRLAFLRRSAIEKSTVREYAVGAKDYMNFCTRHNLPIDPTPDTFSRYIAYTSKFIASGPKYLTGARHFLHDLFPDFDKARADPLVSATIRGSRKVRADPVRRKAPLWVAHLQEFVNIAARTTSFDDVLFAAMLSCCFYALHRSGELVIRNERDLFDWRKVIKRSTLKFHHGMVQYFLPYHKGDPFYHGTDILIASQEVADPVQLLRAYTLLRDARHGARAALFIREDGSLPTRSWFESKLFKVVSREYGGHSPRAGGCTFYASLGIPAHILQAMGRWSSTTFEIYIRENPTVRIQQELAVIRQRSKSASTS